MKRKMIFFVVSMIFLSDFAFSEGADDRLNKATTLLREAKSRIEKLSQENNELKDQLVKEKELVIQIIRQKKELSEGYQKALQDKAFWIEEYRKLKQSKHSVSLLEGFINAGVGLSSNQIGVTAFGGVRVNLAFISEQLYFVGEGGYHVQEPKAGLFLEWRFN